MPATGVVSKAQLGNQATMTIGGISGSTGSETFNEIGQLISMSFDGGSRTIIDTSTLLSTFKEKLGGLADSGKATIMVNRLPQGFDPGQTALATAFGNGYPYDFKLQLPLNPYATPAQSTVGDSATFSAIVSSGYKLSVENDKAIQVEWGVDLNGPITWTAGS